MKMTLVFAVQYSVMCINLTLGRNGYGASKMGHLGYFFEAKRERRGN